MELVHQIFPPSIPLLGNVEHGTIVVKRQGIEDLTYTAGDTFIVGPKTPKHTMGNAKLITQ